ncbi:MAG: hypothetical protein ACR2PT_18205 [Endozoicomonas sp.]
MITNNNAEPVSPQNRGQVGPVTPPDQVENTESERFSDLMKKEDETAEAGNTAAKDGDQLMSPEELQQQMRENIFKTGFNKTMEKAKEIAKELRNG